MGNHQKPIRMLQLQPADATLFVLRATLGFFPSQTFRSWQGEGAEQPSVGPDGRRRWARCFQTEKSVLVFFGEDAVETNQNERLRGAGSRGGSRVPFRRPFGVRSCVVLLVGRVDVKFVLARPRYQSSWVRRRCSGSSLNQRY